METMKQSGLWSSLGYMAPLWLYGGYVFPVVVKLENLTFEVKFDLEGQAQLPPKTIGILTNVFCTSGPNLVILAWMGDELWCGQAQNGVNFDSDLKFDLEGQGWLPPKTIGTLTKVFCIFGPNLVILAWTGDELSRGQTWWRTDGRTGATTIPVGQNWPRVKTFLHSFCHLSELLSLVTQIWLFCSLNICLEKMWQAW